MITRINAYLTFDGDAREAMTFYRDSLGGELSILTVADTPMKEKSPEDKWNLVMHSSLVKDNLTLSATDMVPNGKFTEGNGVTMCLDCSTLDEINEYFGKLSAGGNIIHPLKKEFWGGTFGVLQDKFGKVWMLNTDKS